MKRRSGIQIMGKLIGLIRPLMHVMAAAILLGVTGYLCAIFLTVLAGVGILQIMGIWQGVSLTTLFVCLAVIAVLRGILHYGEQACNHYIAFKLLALIRHKVFAVLRKLCPAKLDGRDKGNLISIITTDIELLEVFYAHTISPIAIAFLTSLIMEIFFFRYHVLIGLFALVGYLAIGVLMPMWNSRRGSEKGMEFRTRFGDLNSFVLDSLRGLDETIQYGCGEKREEQMECKSVELDAKQKEMKKLEGTQRGGTNVLILIFSFGMLFLTTWLHQQGEIGFDAVLLCTILMMSSFGPVVALSSLSNNLMQTLASGERVLSLLEEEPQIEEVSGQATAEFADINCENIDFAYEEEQILKDYSISIPKGSRIGIHGKSGSGKSTLLKLLMRFYDVDSGVIRMGDRKLSGINTNELRDMESYVTQETCLFHDSIANNIAIAKPGASREEIVEAAKKASLHEFIESLPNGYDTLVGELGDTLSGGEKQRIGVARAFLHDAPLLLLDEPTSNLDSLNESIILRSLKKMGKDKTVILVSHRESTMAVAEKVYQMENGRIS
ncbi:amino acid ABC transporter ATP-binding/permease protein [Mediterraneibacter gnavus]|uniref:amino acid ABC transporter ATP-binding/permease protein n=1 Tax=Mediterraneibacter gnavus TaxID=33038 RepID=UPI0036D33132